MGLPEILRILYKNYGGIEWFSNRSLFLLSNCIENAINKELEIPKIIKSIINSIIGVEEEENENQNKIMRSRENILKDYEAIINMIER